MGAPNSIQVFGGKAARAEGLAHLATIHQHPQGAAERAHAAEAGNVVGRMRLAQVEPQGRGCLVRQVDIGVLIGCTAPGSRRKTGQPGQNKQR